MKVAEEQEVEADGAGGDVGGVGERVEGEASQQREPRVGDDVDQQDVALVALARPAEQRS